MILTREVYQTNLRADRLGTRAKKWMDTGIEPRPLMVVCDHDTGNDGYQQLFEGASGLTLTLADKADRDKGIQDTQTRFDVDPDDGKARIYFCENCRDHDADTALVDHGLPTCLVEELVGYVWDEEELKDEPIDYNDHHMDQMRYVTRYVDRHLVPGTGGDYDGPRGEPLLPDYLGSVGTATGW
jgi:phage terminase large subunit